MESKLVKIDEENKDSYLKKFILIKASICILLSFILLLIGAIIKRDSINLFEEFSFARNIAIVIMLFAIIITTICYSVKMNRKYLILIAKISDIVFYFGDVLVIVYFLFTVLIIPVRVKGCSMEPTYFEDDRLLISRQFYKIERDDVVIIAHEEDDLWIKRVVGLPGDDVSYIGNILYINGNEITTMSEHCKDEYGNYILSEGIIADNEYLVLGDNRNESYDSRYVGYIKKNEIMGEVLVRIKKG